MKSHISFKKFHSMSLLCVVFVPKSLMIFFSVYFLVLKNFPTSHRFDQRSCFRHLNAVWRVGNQYFFLNSFLSGVLNV